MDYVLEKWDAIELFCKIAAKASGVSIKELQNEIVIDRYLKMYASRAFAGDVSKKITDSYNNFVADKKKTKISSAKKSEVDIREVPYWSRLLYDLGAAIRNGKPIVLSNEQLIACLHFIGEKKFIVSDKQQLDRFTPNTKRQRLYFTKWCLYFIDDLDEAEIPAGQKKQTLSRAILTLKPFGKAEIIRALKGNKNRIYEGYYDLYDSNYLLIRTRIKGYDRDLRMIFYVGSFESMKLSLGIASNILPEEFFSQKILIEPFDDVSDNKNIPDFFDTSKRSEIIPKYVWDYFDNPSNNIISLPAGLTNSTQLAFYLNTNRKNDF